MAIKRTIGRSKYVQPTGIVVDSGGQAMAQASQNIAKAITSITEGVDKNQLETAYLEAEAQGLHLGSSTNKDGSPKPIDLMTLNSAFKPSFMFNNANKQKANKRFKDQAILAYGLNVKNDITNKAHNSLEKNKGAFFNGKTIVQTELEKYILEWKDKIAPEIYSKLKPSIENVIGNATRSASAMHIQNVKTQAIDTASKSALNLIEEKSNWLVAQSQNDGDKDPKDTNLMFEFEQEAIFDLIRSNTNSEADYLKFISSFTNQLQVKVTEKNVTAAHIAKMPHSEIVKMINDIADENEDPSVNAELIKEAGLKKASELFNIDLKQQQENVKASTVKYNDFLALMLEGKIPTINDIDNSDMEESHKNQIKVQMRNETIRVDNKIKLADKNINLIHLNDIKIGTPYVKDIAQAHMLARIKQGKVATAEIISFQTTWQNRYTSDLGANNDIQYAPFMKELGANSNYFMSPGYFEGMKETLIKRGVIGTSTIGQKPLMTVTAYMEKVSNYAKRYEVELEQRYNSKLTKDQLINGKVGGAEELKTLDDTDDVPNTIKFNGESIPINIFHENKDIANASLKQAVQFTVDYNTLHPTLVDAFDGFENINDLDMFGQVVNAHSMLAESFRLNQISNNKLNVIIEKAGLKSGLISNARSIGMEATNKIATNQEESKARILSKHMQKDETEYDVFERTFENFLTDNTLIDTIVNSTNVGKILSMSTGYTFSNPKSLDHKRLLHDFKNQAGGTDLRDVVLNDPRVMKMLSSLFWADVNGGGVQPDEKSMHHSMGKAMQKVFSQIGIQESNVNAEGKTTKRWTFNPALPQFQSTLPSTVTKDGASETIPVTLTNEDLYRYINHSLQGQPKAFSKTDGTLEAHNKMQYEIIANEHYGKIPSYSIYVKTEYGENKLVAGNFRFDWANSPQKDAYRMALKTIKDNDFRTFIYGLPGMQSQQVRAIYNRWNENMRPDSFIMDLQTLYNKSQSFLPESKRTYIDMNKYEAAKKSMFLSTLFLDMGLWAEK